MATSESSDHWDPELAARLIGSTVIVGMTYLRPDGELDRQEQMFGMVVEADPKMGILIEFEGSRIGTSYRLPPQTSVFTSAPPGTYRLRSTGEVVVDPDYTCAWTVNPHQQ
jgi:hypothetical protein